MKVLRGLGRSFTGYGRPTIALGSALVHQTPSCSLCLKSLLSQKHSLNIGGNIYIHVYGIVSIDFDTATVIGGNDIPSYLETFRGFNFVSGKVVLFL